jgi:subtilase family serine protease
LIHLAHLTIREGRERSAVKTIHLALVAERPETIPVISAWARSKHLTVRRETDHFIDVEASLSQIEEAFQVSLTVDADGNWFSDQEPQRPAGVHAVVGLDSRPRLRRSIAYPTAGTTVQYRPADIRSAYAIPAELTGEGQTIGLLEFDSGYSRQDLRQFAQESGIGLPVNLELITLDGGSNDGGGSDADVEATLDIQWAYAVAPKAMLVVYEASGGTTYAAFALHMLHALERVVSDNRNRPTVLSISYGDAESSFPKDDVLGWEKMMQAAAGKGITVCVAAGDQGAYGRHDPNGPRTASADAPASCPSALAVGGTTLRMQGQTVVEETAWSNVDDNGATGGGVSSFFSKPAYQQQVAIPGLMRGIPDVAANADPDTGYWIIFGGQSGVVGGTSVSAPVWAGIVAGINQLRAARGLAPLGDFHDALYRLQGRGFRDITRGDNSYDGVRGYQAGPGWDFCTGWGAPNVSELAQLLLS